MNVTHCFAEHLETLGIGTVGVDIFVGHAPSANQTTDEVWWVKSAGGIQTKKPTGECMKDYAIDVFFRSRDYGSVYEKMQALEESLNCDGCPQLCTYDTIDISSAVISVDEDLDAEDRKLGVLRANIKIYEDCGASVS